MTAKDVFIWFWFAMFCVAVLWSAYLMATLDIAKRDVRRLMRERGALR